MTDRITSINHPELVGKKPQGKLCPNGHQFVIRVNREDDSLFMGCTGYPECRETDEIPTAILLKLAGAETLPGMGDEED